MLKKKEVIKRKMGEIQKVVKVEELEASYNGRDPVVTQINFDLDEGEMLLLLGKTGSGKTTVLNALAGNIPRLIKGRVNGKILVKGVDPRRAESDELIHLLGLVPQEPWNGILGDTVEDEILISKMLSRKEVEKEIELAKSFNLLGIYNRTTFTLSAGETQKLAIFSRILLDSHVIMLDEPSTFLDMNSREELKRIIVTLLEAGKSIIVTAHDKGYWEGVAKKIVELPKRERESWFESLANLEIEKVNEIPRIKVRNLEFKYYPYKNLVFKNFNLSLEGGGIFLIKGQNGTGKTTLLKLLSGIVKPRKGEIFLSHHPLLLPDNPLLFFSKPTVREELELFLGRRIEKLRFPDRRIKELSSGERRLISLLVASLSKSPIILLDEPTVGLDPEYKATIIEIFRSLSDTGRMLLISTHDPDLDAFADEIIKIEEVKNEFA